MNFQHLFIASDHAGAELKKSLIAFCALHHLRCDDLGSKLEADAMPEGASMDYPDYAQEVARKVLATPLSAGILICGAGIGMSISANRFPGIRAALCLDKEGVTASLARRHNDANILCLGARLISEADAQNSLKVFLETPFEGGRHVGRLLKIEALSL
jgi:ribose 5-phosphate isomerase B